MFTLFEELLLLSIHEEKGTFIRSTVDRVKVGLVGAILAELALVGKIQASDNHRLQLVDGSKTNDVVLDDVLGVLKKSEKGKKFGYWINTLNQRTEKFHKRIMGILIQKEIVTADDDHFQWVIPSPLQAETKASTKYWLKKRLRANVLAQEDTQPRDVVLLSLVRACGLLDLVFLRDERKLADRYINGLVFNQAMKDPVIQTIQEIGTAIAAVFEED